MLTAWAFATSVLTEMAYVDVIDRSLADAVLDDYERIALTYVGFSFEIWGEQHY